MKNNKINFKEIIKKINIFIKKFSFFTTMWFTFISLLIGIALLIIGITAYITASVNIANNGMVEMIIGVFFLLISIGGIVLYILIFRNFKNITNQKNNYKSNENNEIK